MARHCGGRGALGAPARLRRRKLKPSPGGLYSADNAFNDFGFGGTPQQLIEQMRLFIGLGVDYFMLDCRGFPKLTTLELLINEVLPALNG